MKLSKPWVLEWQKKVNEDKVLKVVGKYFTMNFFLGIGEAGYLVRMKNGTMEEITDDIPNLFQWQFAMKASEEAWEKFTRPVPPPRYNDIWAMARYQEIKIEGDSKALWQNLRALAWMLDIMRTVQVEG